MSIRYGSPASLRAAAAANRQVAPVNAAAKEGIRIGGGAERLIHPGGHSQPAAAAAVAVLQFEHAGSRVEAGAAEKDGADVVSLHVVVSQTRQARIHCKWKPGPVKNVSIPRG